MPMGFWSGIVSGNVGTVECPHCRAKRKVARRPTPFVATCPRRRRDYRVTDSGAGAVREK
jgi:hypothetical protein